MNEKNTLIGDINEINQLTGLLSSRAGDDGENSGGTRGIVTLKINLN